MEFQTLSLVIGNEACNANCDFCIAKMTPSITSKQLKFNSMNTRNMRIACRLAAKGGVTTALLTGKGEPTLFPADITLCLETIATFFPLIELQTNGLVFSEDKDKWEKILVNWYNLGLTTIALSIVHYDNERNRAIYCDEGWQYNGEYPDLATTISFLHKLGFAVRLNCIGLRTYICNELSLKELIKFARKNEVEQLTWREVFLPANSRNKTVAERVKILSCDLDKIEHMKSVIEEEGHLLLSLQHGAKIYDFDGQNVCLTNCLTRGDKIVRQLIFVDGHLRYDWEYKGAIII